MGIFKKVFGGGGDIRMPAVVETPPAPTTVTSADTSADTGSESKKNKRRGFASTQVSTDRNTIAGSATGRKTLG
ncbi:hypothetical protein [Phascolarctobacterium sp.]